MTQERKHGLLLRKCDVCNKYTLKKICESEECNGKNIATRSAHPARFTLTDNLSKYRLAVKKKHGILNNNNIEEAHLVKNIEPDLKAREKNTFFESTC